MNEDAAGAVISEALENPEDMSAVDLREEAGRAIRADEEVECYRLTYEGGQRGDLLYLPSDGRAGIATGGDSEWTDAASAQDALDRYNEGRLQP